MNQRQITLLKGILVSMETERPETALTRYTAHRCRKIFAIEKQKQFVAFFGKTLV